MDFFFFFSLKEYIMQITSERWEIKGAWILIGYYQVQARRCSVMSI